MGRSLVTVHLKLASDCPKFIIGGQNDRPLSSADTEESLFKGFLEFVRLVHREAA